MMRTRKRGLAIRQALVRPFGEQRATCCAASLRSVIEPRDELMLVSRTSGRRGLRSRRAPIVSIHVAETGNSMPRDGLRLAVDCWNGRIADGACGCAGTSPIPLRAGEARAAARRVAASRV